jgi:hypothetical protein
MYTKIFLHQLDLVCYMISKNLPKSNLAEVLLATLQVSYVDEPPTNTRI